MGVRLNPILATTARSAMRAPGGSCPEMIRDRSSVYTRVTLSGAAWPAAGRAVGERGEEAARAADDARRGFGEGTPEL